MSRINTQLQPLIDHPALRAAHAAVEKRERVTVSGLIRPAKAVAAAALAHRLARPIIVLTSDNETADRLRSTAVTVLAWLEPETKEVVGTLPAFDATPYDGRSPHAEIMERRAVALWNLARGQTRLLFAPLATALGRFQEAAFYRSLALELKVGDELAIEDLAEHLAGVGYEPAEPVTQAGQYSVRGGIVDFFAPETAWPLRLEFLGDRVESLREFDPSSQRSRQPAATAMVLPLTETRRSVTFFKQLIQRLAERSGASADPHWAAAFSAPFPGWEFYAPLAEAHPQTLFSLVENPVVIWDEPIERGQQLQRKLEDLATRFDEVRDVTPPPPRPEDVFLTQAEFEKAIEQVAQIEFKELGLDVHGPLSVAAHTDVGEGLYNPLVLDSSGQNADPSARSREHHQGDPLRREVCLATQPAPTFRGSVKAMAEDMRARLEHGEQVIFVAPAPGTTERLHEIFSEYQIPFETMKPGTIPASLPPAQTETGGRDKAALAGTSGGETPAQKTAAVLLGRGEIEAGVAFPELGLLFLSERDVFGDYIWGATRRKEKSAASSFLSDLSDLKVGDYVVHVDHGIGLYQGLKQIPLEGRTRDFMLLTYQEDARLYVPLERLDLVGKYRSSGGVKPKLDRLGGAAWQRTKKRVERALRNMAEELLRLYAERKMRGGEAFGADTAWQKEFEESFPFEETPDQLTALADIKRDLETPEPMDRLLCGDVGYGKTELAMRAALKVVQDSKQVAVLAPTTVLAFQHYNTFRRRMAAFPIRIEMLSRFRSAAEQKKTLEEAEAGRLDILIGTHRLLSKDVRFQDLGLLIVDEEQRFGVAAKEKLKSLRANVDVLTMSATPIPRTLHMALGGLRDLSVIESPPQGRLAIQTVVAPFNDGLVQSALRHEMERQGQVYFVHNRVESIFSVAALVQRLAPEARIGVAHGQMGERELERVMLKFMENKYDVLVATALVENGLDIPRANTMIVNHAERFGLADLYQLRGRVGRSDRRAYAYFLVPAEDSLTPIAKRRLAALKEFSDLGAGFRLAALDLELRGAGNILGGEQHGHLNAIGIDLYLKMLEEAVNAIKGEPARLEIRTTFNLGLDIKIPDDYIRDEQQRLKMYKRISALASPEARHEMEGELEDRYGPLPPSVRNLLEYALVKTRAEQLMVQVIERKGETLRMRFHQETPVSPEQLKTLLRSRRDATFRPDGTLEIQLRDHQSNLLAHVQNVLQGLQAQD